MKLILHVGHGKCGSSTIQNFLKQNLTKFSEKKIGLINQHLKLSEPGDQNWKEPGAYFHNILFKTKDTTQFKKDLAGVKKDAERNNLDSIILSDERLSSPRCFNGSVDIMESINELFDEIEIIYYIRRQDEFMISAWQQWGIKEGLTIEDFVNQALDVDRPNYLLSINEFKTRFGENSIRLGFLNKSTLKNEDLITDFLFKLGFENTGLNIVKPKNKGIYAGYSDILRRTSTLFDTPFDNSIKSYLDKNIHHASHLLYSKEKPALFYSFSARIMEHFEESNRKIHGEYFPDTDFELLFDKNKHKLESEAEAIGIEIEQLKNIIAIQNDMIFTLIDRHNHHVENTQQISTMQKVKFQLKKIFK